MKTIALIGDSIRMGYQPFVQKALAGKAKVWAPEINGGDSRNVLKYLGLWIEKARPDIIHINCGLHDVKTPFDSGIPAVPISEYQDNIKTILGHLSKAVSRVIWASTTPVNTVWHHANKEFDRFEDDIVAYNTAVKNTTDALNISVNDLYSAVMEAGRDALLLPDGVHFTANGYILLGECVTAKLVKVL